MLNDFVLEEINNIEDYEYFGSVFDLQVEEDHSYSVNDDYVVHNCSDAAHGLGAQIIADGGCREPADIVKSFGAGADFVMLGTMLSGHDESAGDLIQDSDGTYYKEVYGMSSDYAMRKYYGQVNEYRASEGEYNLVEYKGPVEETIRNILGGIRSACTYVGAKNLKDLPKCTTFLKTNQIK